jgi:alpha-L-rhamnosidase
MAGIDAMPGDAGFHTVYLHPTFDLRLGSLDFSYASLYGPIKSSWSTRGAGTTWKVTIPPNTTGRLPVSVIQGEEFTLGGVPLEQSKRVKTASAEDGSKFYELAAGSYSFEVVRK